jgi:hypothetical protein
MSTSPFRFEFILQSGKPQLSRRTIVQVKPILASLLGYGENLPHSSYNAGCNRLHRDGLYDHRDEDKVDCGDCKKEYSEGLLVVLLRASVTIETCFFALYVLRFPPYRIEAQRSGDNFVQAFPFSFGEKAN